MARSKGTANLAASIEVLAGAPLDARSLVPTKEDLTIASNFPYAYVGMQTTVQEELKTYMYMGGDISDENNWKEVGGSTGNSGGGVRTASTRMIQEGQTNTVSGVNTIDLHEEQE